MAIDVSRDDRYVAIKFGNVARILDLEKGQKLDHKLPRPEDGKPGPCGHHIAFAHDCKSFMASTRVGPEKVITYWSHCMERSKPLAVQSTAPCVSFCDLPKKKIRRPVGC